MRKHGKRRKYVAGPAPLYQVLGGCAPFTESEIVSISAPLRMSLQKFTIGSANDVDWNTLAHVANVVTLRGAKIAQEVLNCGQSAQKAVLTILERYKVSTVWDITPEELSSLSEAMDVHEQMLRLSQPKLMLEALKETNRRVEEGRVVVLFGDELVSKPANGGKDGSN